MRMSISKQNVALALGAALALVGCKDEAPAPSAGDSGSSGGADSGSEGSSGALPEDRAEVVHSFGNIQLGPLEETQPCIQWTLDNDEPLYVSAVTIANDGGFHHSNWFIVPEDLFPGDDGFFNCGDRGFTEIEAAISGTVLTAQSTQSRFETMQLPPGVVVKAPPRHKVIAGGHLLNLSASNYDTELRMALEIVHPREVEVVAAPFRLTYYDLQIPGFTEARFTSHCNVSSLYEDASGEPLDIKLYYVLPHYHYLGNYFDLSILGGPNDGTSVFRLDGFNADANGQGFPEPINLSGAEGLSFTCGFNNWTDFEVGWGIGDQEMCVMLGLADSRVLMDASADSNQVVGTDGEILLNESNCNVIGLPKNAGQSLPTAEEIAAPLYVPPSDPTDAGLPPVDDCVDVPAGASAAPGEATLSRVRDTLLVSTCQFSSCHAGSNAAAGLDLASPTLHSELLEHQVQANTTLPLIAPGDPEGSWLYQLVSRCNPEDGSGAVVSHMPLNSPKLSDPALAALLRDWINAGAQDN
ncbi:MAG: hypothetical protein K0V04_34945 [Deltaproteobacteria bacterium]|nr:hypothetical protein [Deltaproteobacteria bacterium]